MTIALITPPASEPLSLIEIKAHLRVDHSHEDALISDTLKAARQYVELASGQKLITQAWRQYETAFPVDRKMVLKVSPVQSIAAITLFDRDGTPQLLAAQDSEIIRGSEPAILEFLATVDSSVAENGMEVDYIAGYGDLGIDVPDTLKRAILLLVAHWYEFRGAIAPQDQPVSLPPGFDTLMAPFRRVHL